MLSEGTREVNYSDGTPMPDSHRDWFESGPVTPSTLEAWLDIIRESNAREKGLDK